MECQVFVITPCISGLQLTCIKMSDQRRAKLICAMKSSHSIDRAASNRYPCRSHVKRRASWLLGWWLLIVMASSVAACPDAFVMPICGDNTGYLHSQNDDHCDRPSTDHSPPATNTHCQEYLGQPYFSADAQAPIREVGFIRSISYPVILVSSVPDITFSRTTTRGRHRSSLPAPVLFQRVPRLLI